MTTPRYHVFTPDLTKSYPFLRIYEGDQDAVLISHTNAPPKGGDLWYDTSPSVPVLRYYNAGEESWLLLQDYNTGASAFDGQNMFCVPSM